MLVIFSFLSLLAAYQPMVVIVVLGVVIQHLFTPKGFCAAGAVKQGEERRTFDECVLFYQRVVTLFGNGLENEEYKYLGGASRRIRMPSLAFSQPHRA